MQSLGFIRSKNAFIRVVNEETTLRVSVQILKDRPSGAFFPRVGFINWKIQKFIDHLDGSKTPVRDVPPTLSVTLGYLIPGPLRTEWLFSDIPSMHKAVCEIVQAIREYGMPFMMRYPDLSFLRAWAQDPATEKHASCRYVALLRAVIFYLLGDWDSARRLVTQEISATGKDTSDQYHLVPIVRLQEILNQNNRGHTQLKGSGTGL